MRNFLAFLGAVVVVFLGAGYYLGWYKIDREASTAGHSRLQVDIDQDKIGKDVKSGADKVKNVIDKNAPDAKVPDSKPLSSIDPQEEEKKVEKKVVGGFVDLVKDGWLAPDKK
jgi:hypothetical protein